MHKDANPELVDKFCYLGDMLSVDGDADASVENRIQIGWNKFRQLVPLVTVVSNWSIVVCNQPHHYGNSHATWHHTLGRGDIPIFTQPAKAGTSFRDPGGMQVLR